MRLGEFDQENQVLGPDGFLRPAREEIDLNQAFAALFGEHPDAAARVLAYLRSITLLHVLGPKSTDNELRHMEGQRHIVAIIERRLKLGRDRSKPKPPGQRTGGQRAGRRRTTGPGTSGPGGTGDAGGSA